MTKASPAKQWSQFLSRFAPSIRVVVMGALVRMRKRLPGAVELVYDNYNALVIGFGPTEKTSQAVFSLAIYPRWVNLFFLQGKGLKDPSRLLRGSGNVVRHIPLSDPTVLDQPSVSDLIDEALAKASTPLDPAARRRMVIKSISVKQRSRRP